ncbi:MAG: hypothetical protein AAGL17_13090 [Cyanobacteria bacterium J06576_12]
MKITVSRLLALGVLAMGLPIVGEHSAQAYSQSASTPASATTQVSELNPQVLAQFPGNGVFPNRDGRFPDRLRDSDRRDRDDWEDRREDFEDEREDRREDFEDEREDRREDFEDDLENCRDEDDDDRRECMEDLRGDFEDVLERDSRPFGDRDFPRGGDFQRERDFPFS